MKNVLKLLSIVILITSSLRCTNNNNKPNTVFISEETLTYNDTSGKADAPSPIVSSQNNIWEFKSVNNENIENYIYETTPFLMFSIDSSYIFINTGCNTYIGECKFKNNQEISFDKIFMKEEICPIDALEREIVYMLDITDSYSIDDNNLILYNKRNPIGYLSTK